MKKLVHYKTNPGTIGEYDIYTAYEGLGGYSIHKSETKVQIFNGTSLILDMNISKIEEDFLSVTYCAEDRGVKIRIVCIKPQLAARVGDTITFASWSKNGFAVHYEIE